MSIEAYCYSLQIELFKREAEVCYFLGYHMIGDSFEFNDSMQQKQENGVS